ncbi:hypothetical protein RYH73_17640 [Olivibacter sp. CPCC 100613]|uniref:hypothetical protein n=1 Tax=Olivibacter sp. CPCC 100613 TaxID=3079931 RepID=UPI002FFCA089
MFLFHSLCVICTAQNRYPEHSAFSSSVGLQVGTAGVGAEFNYPIRSDLNVRLHASYLPEVRKHYHGLIYQPKRALTGLNIDWQPLFGGDGWLARKWFVSLGFYYFMKHSMGTFRESRVIGRPREKYYEADLSKIRPYVGMGIARLALSKHLFLNLNGGFFIPTARTRIEMANEEQYDPGSIAQVKKMEQDRYNRVWAHLATSLNIQVGLFYNLAYRFNTYGWQPKEWKSKRKKDRHSGNKQFR